MNYVGHAKIDSNNIIKSLKLFFNIVFFCIIYFSYIKVSEDSSAI